MKYVFILRLMTKSATTSFKDEKATVKNGKFFYYHAKGFIDSSGKYAAGELDGEWYYRNEEGKITRKKTFAKGVLVADTTFKINNESSFNNGNYRSGWSLFSRVVVK